jgi:probable addiction module antidote protein
MTIKTKLFDAAEVLTNEARIAAYLEEAFETGDPDSIISAIGDVLRARNVAQLARETGLTRETLYRAFSPGGNPTVSTLVSVVGALGFDLSVKPRHEPTA